MHPNAISICRNPVTTCHKDVTDEAVRRPEPSHLSQSFVTVLRQMAEKEETAETPIKTHISLFSFVICRTVTGGGAGTRFLAFPHVNPLPRLARAKSATDAKRRPLQMAGRGKERGL